MLEVYTSTIRYSGEDGLDITVKSSGEMGRIFAPTWDMVLDHKNGLITDEEYTQKYYELMRQSYKTYKKKWERILSKEKIVFLCYCPSDKFCHRKVLAEIFVKLGAIYKGEI